MKVALDHVGIAVEDLQAALAFYRDALGLDVEAPEEVVSQRVRAHFIPVGDSTLELLEATAADSPIAKYVGKRGAGLHHVTLRVDDIAAVLAQLKARGVRLIDEVPRPGAEHAQVAFIHPSSAHGVLVELKQRPAEPPLVNGRYTVGQFDVTSLYDGWLRLDGGAMFGVIPKALWSKKSAPDDRNRITLAMRPLLIRGERTVLVDAGIGGKDSPRFHDIYGVERQRNLDHSLAEAGVSADDIDVVIATHLHFDHVGGFTVRDAAGVLRPRFPNARYVIRRGEWEDATHTHVRNRASYIADNFVPLLAAGVVDFIDDDGEILPGVRVQRAAGHTDHHQMVWIESGNARALYLGDLMPTVAHMPDAWGMGFDLAPMDTLASKQRTVRDILARETLLFFEHDPATPAGYLADVNGTRTLTPTP